MRKTAKNGKKAVFDLKNPHKNQFLIAQRFFTSTLYLLNLYLCLARSFFRRQGLGWSESGFVLLYIEHFCAGRKRRMREKEPPTKCKKTA